MLASNYNSLLNLGKSYVHIPLNLMISAKMIINTMTTRKHNTAIIIICHQVISSVDLTVPLLPAGKQKNIRVSLFIRINTVEPMGLAEMVLISRWSQF